MSLFYFFFAITSQITDNEYSILVVDEYDRPEPVDYIIDKEQFRLETLNSHTQYLDQLPLESEKRIDAMQVKRRQTLI